MKKKVLIVLIILVLGVLFHIHTSDSIQRYQLVSHTLSSVGFGANITGVNILHDLNKECLEEECDLFDYSIGMAYFFSGLATYSGSFDLSEMYSGSLIDVTQLDLFVEKESQKNQQTERSLGKRHGIQKGDMQSIPFPDREKSIEYFGYVFSGSEIGTKALHNRTVIQQLIDTKKIEQEKQEEAQKKQKEEEKEEQGENEEGEGNEQDGGDTSDRENKQEENTDEENNESEGKGDQDENKQEQKDGSQGEGDKQEDQEPTLSENTKEQLQEYAEQLQQQQAQQQQYFNKKPQHNSQQPQDLFEALFGRQQMRQEVDMGGEVDR